MAAALLRTSRGAERFFSNNLWRRIHTAVWWDLLQCEIPEGFERRVADVITEAVANMNYGRPVFIKAYHREALSRQMKRVFLDTGVSPIRVTTGFHEYRNVTSAKMLMDMFFWTMANPPPANLLVISNDALLSYGLHELAGQHYNILLARDGRVPRRLRSPATTLWRWKTLLTGGPPERSTVQNNAPDPSPIHGESVLGGPPSILPSTPAQKVPMKLTWKPASIYRQYPEMSLSTFIKRIYGEGRPNRKSAQRRNRQIHGSQPPSIGP